MPLKFLKQGCETKLAAQIRVDTITKQVAITCTRVSRPADRKFVHLRVAVEKVVQVFVTDLGQGLFVPDRFEYVWDVHKIATYSAANHLNSSFEVLQIEHRSKIFEVRRPDSTSCEARSVRSSCVEHIVPEVVLFAKCA